MKKINWNAPVSSKISVLVLAFTVWIFAGFVLLAVAPTNQTAQVGAGVFSVSPVVSGSKDNFTIELDYPDYLPDFLRHPQKIFSGRKLRIVPSVGQLLSPQREIGLQQYNKTSKSFKTVKKLDIQKVKGDALVAEIPQDTPSGAYVIEFKNGDQISSIPIEIDGSISKTGGTKIAKSSVPKKIVLDKAVESVKRLSCGDCYWESVSGTNPLNRDYGYFFSSNGFSMQTKDGWVTNEPRVIDDLADPLLKSFFGDPTFTFNQEGKVVMVAAVYNGKNLSANEPMSGAIYEQNKAFEVPSNSYHSYHQILLSEIPNFKLRQAVVFDYPKIAVDTYENSLFFKSIYVFAYSAYVDNLETSLFTVRDGVVSRQRTVEIGLSRSDQAESVIVGPGGVIYVGMDVGQVKVYSSTDGGKSFSKNVVAETKYLGNCPPRVSTKSNRAAFAPSAAPLALDAKGRLYVAWADKKKCVQDLNFEYPSYGYDYDVYTSFSDDKGKTWSAPKRVNDDVGGGNQFFPSIAVDETDNSVYVAFIDHRNNQDKPQVDIYLAKSSDRGATFSKNIQVNDENIPLSDVNGGREPGDYLSMVSIGKKNVFVIHPCVGGEWLVKNNPLSNSKPSDVCVSIITKLEPPDLSFRAATSNPRTITIAVATSSIASSTNAFLGAFEVDASKSGEDVLIKSANFQNISLKGIRRTDLTNCGLTDSKGTPLVTGSNLVNPTNQSQNVSFAFNGTGYLVKKGTKEELQVRCDLSATAKGTYRWDLINLNAAGFSSGAEVKIKNPKRALGPVIYAK